MNKFDYGRMEMLRGKLISLAAQMARRQNMPSPEDWQGWGKLIPKKLWREARVASDKASDQCAEWAHELRKIVDALEDTESRQPENSNDI